MYIEKPFPEVIRIVTSKPGILQILLPFIIPLIWAWANLGSPSTLEEIGNRIGELSGSMWVFVLLPMPLVFVGARNLLHYIVGLNYDFDERKQEVLRNGKLVARFDEIERVHVSRTTRENSPDTYGLELYIKSRRRPLSIDKSTDAANIIQTADSIETMIGKAHTGLQSETAARQKMALSPGQITQQIPRTLLIVFPLAGFAVIGFGVYLFIDTLDFLRSSREVPGTVVENITRHDSNGDITYAPKVRFVTVEDGQEVMFVSDSSSSPPSYRTGESVVVLYQEGDPTGARIKSFFSLWLPPTFLCIFGAVFVVFPLLASRISRRATQTRQMSK